MRETQAEGKAGSMQEAWRGTRSRVSKITPWAEGGTKPLSYPGCPLTRILQPVTCWIAIRDWESLIIVLQNFYLAALTRWGVTWLSFADTMLSDLGAQRLLDSLSRSRMWGEQYPPLSSLHTPCNDPWDNMHKSTQGNINKLKFNIYILLTFPLSLCYCRSLLCRPALTGAFHGIPSRSLTGSSCTCSCLLACSSVQFTVLMAQSERIPWGWSLSLPPLQLAEFLETCVLNWKCFSLFLPSQQRTFGNVWSHFWLS